jgi:membrane-bound serine protease (ClpP class)
MTVEILIILGLFLVGLMLLALEAFVIPGFGITGVAGALVVIYASVQAWIDLGPAWGATLVIFSVLATTGLLFWLPRSRLGKRVTLHEAITEVAGYGDDAIRAGVTVGSQGTTQTELRPSGFAVFGDHRIEVRSSGEWLDRQITVKITEMRDGKVFVEPVEPIAPGV